MRRVVITGLGALTPLGLSSQSSWDAVIDSKSGISEITDDVLRVSDLPVRIGGLVKNADKAEGWPKGSERRMDRFMQLAIAAASQAVVDSGIHSLSEDEKQDISVCVGSGIGGIATVEQGALTLENEGYRRISPFFVPASIINLAAGHIALNFGFKGPNICYSTACSSGAHAIGEAYLSIKNGQTQISVSGGSESCMCRLGIAGFFAARALSVRNSDPQKASRPWDRGRDGFVMSEGAGFLILEELEHAKKRGAKIYAEICGYGATADAHHITAPDPEGKGAYEAMKLCCESARINTDEISYINAHGTSTPLGDKVEILAIKRLFNDDAKRIAISSTKSSIGHLLGAAGSVEAIFSIYSIYNSVLPPTLNLDDPDEGFDLDFVPHISREMDVNIAMSNSFGFGGTNASLLFKKYK
ncbi:3-oxoacyl-[acyl-carrier-protein] synthase 2 [Candidatus Cyrtobacter comes]|uniref:3-oxoacyl-[acyl-carrier-protein] synthase 2 n=1 Tax=Candidatus Cyrtobacter comes TaxID=675776 RepID=A0ABU5L6M7_9RICK|nr:beta-ketoacyl-ACP synthase II [Candidatus Cyrtobacter comes]MDZ5761707.1 3-oxoacyl-[acyl-carrier-protein] synthase 2 [Candidatus Cyrtobacter comes]